MRREIVVSLGSMVSDGLVAVFNNKGEPIATMGADEYGNDMVGAYDRKGKGRTLTPKP